MATLAHAAATLVGAVLVVVVLRDIWHTLFRPGARGRASEAISGLTWRVYRAASRGNPSLLALAGPSAMTAVIATWTVLLVVGWALVYWPHLPDGVLLAPGLDPDEHGDLLDAVYLSLVTIATLGYGDITPRTDLLRLLGPIEALVGFALLTASISWVLSVYPVLSRRRRLGHEVSLILDAEVTLGSTVGEMEDGALERLLADLTAQVIVVRSDVLQFPITYYFRDTDPRTALPAALRSLVRLAADGVPGDRAMPVRFQRARLRGAIEEFSDVLASQFLRGPSGVEAVTQRYLEDHRFEPG